MFDLAELESLDRGLTNLGALRVELADRIAESQSVLTFGRLLAEPTCAAVGGNVVRLVPKGGRHG